MLTCFIVAGTLFMTNAPDGYVYNFHHLGRFSLNRDHSTLYAGGPNFSVPEPWRQMGVRGILETCAEQAEIGQRTGALSE